MPDPITNRHKKHIRNLKRNKSGRKETVLLATKEEDNKYYAYPTITFKGNEKKRDQTFDEAYAAGEAYEFKSERRAERFAGGSWKKNKDKRTRDNISKVMKAFRARKKAERQKKRNG